MMGGEINPRIETVFAPAPDGYVAAAEFKILNMQYWAVKKSFHLLLKRQMKRK